MTKKIFKSIFFVACAVLLASFLLIMGVLYGYFGTLQTGQMETELSLAAAGVEADGQSYLEKLDTKEIRFTYVASDGTVLYDTLAEASGMENHSEREEIKQAMETGSGESSRYSATLTEETLYYAKRLSDGNVLRISVSRMTIPALALGMLHPILVVLLFTMIFSFALANEMSRRIVKPLNSLNLDRPLENEAYDEIAPLLTRIELQHRQIRYQKTELENRQKEFYAVIRNMKEGLVLLNEENVILSMNPAAGIFFSADERYIGKDFLTLERNHEINRTLKEAAQEGYAELEVSRSGREYQLNASRIEENGKITGMVILVFDVTEKVFAERNRREFTANVSHELKTPLQSIMGSAELIENGLVKQEDLPRFAGLLRAEAARLVALIEDIIRLSRLDEKTEPAEEMVELHALAMEEAENLAQAAESRHVTVTVDGEEVTVKGVRQLLHEIISNLCDNAIKYNVEGGSIRVTVKAENGQAVVRVADTGIGIPAEHQARVFERFYRVDKSRSKESGGTGLGLSIVKHAVEYLGGSIRLESETGKGTTVTVTLPTA